MDRRLLFDHDTSTLEPGLLFAEAAFMPMSTSSVKESMKPHLSKTAYVVNTFQQKVSNRRSPDAISTTYHIILFELLGIRLARGTMPNQNLQTFGMCFNFIPPLHDSDSRSSEVKVWITSEKVFNLRNNKIRSFLIRYEQRDNLDGLTHSEESSEDKCKNAE